MALFPSAAQITPESRSTLSSPPKARQDDCPLLLFFDAEHRIHQDSEFSPSLFFFLETQWALLTPALQEAEDSEALLSPVPKQRVLLALRDPYGDAQTSHHK